MNGWQRISIQKMLKIQFCWRFMVKLSSIGWWLLNLETGNGDHQSDQENRSIGLFIAIHRLKAKSEEQWTMVSLIGECFFTFSETVQPLYVIKLLIGVICSTISWLFFCVDLLPWVALTVIQIQPLRGCEFTRLRYSHFVAQKALKELNFNNRRVSPRQK